MIDWLVNNHTLIAAISSFGTLVIWTIYLHIFLQSHRRQRKPMLVINRGEAQDLTGRCLVTNMSQEAVYIHSVVVDLWVEGTRHRAFITDAEDIRSTDDAKGWAKLTRQGPLQPGTMVDMGAFGSILNYLVRTLDEGQSFAASRLAKTATACEISILGIYGSEYLLIGAVRRFRLEPKGDTVSLKAEAAETRQITSGRERRQLSAELAREL